MFAPLMGPRRRNCIALTVAAATVSLSLASGAIAGDEPPEAVIGTFESVQDARAAAGKPATFDFEPGNASASSGEAESREDDDVSRAYADAMDAMENRDTAAAQRKFEHVIARDPDGHLAKSARRFLADLYRGQPADSRPTTQSPAATAKFETPPSALGARDIAKSPPLEKSPPLAKAPPLEKALATEAKDLGVDVPTGVEEDFIIKAGDRVFFAAGSAELGQRARIVLAAQARWLAARPEVTAVVEGHADDGAIPDEQTAALSEARANAVRDRLIEEGIPATRLAVFAQGRAAPVANCPGSDCAAQNRRVVTVLKTVASRTYGQRSRGQSLASDGGRLPTQ
jgi:outer membrane protein OmpA-like peptidoglycan-associated protein